MKVPSLFLKFVILFVFGIRTEQEPESVLLHFGCHYVNLEIPLAQTLSVRSIIDSERNLDDHIVRNLSFYQDLTTLIHFKDGNIHSKKEAAEQQKLVGCVSHCFWMAFQLTLKCGSKMVDTVNS